LEFIRIGACGVYAQPSLTMACGSGSSSGPWPIMTPLVASITHSQTTAKNLVFPLIIVDNSPFHYKLFMSGPLLPPMARKVDARAPVSVWSEKEVLDGEVVDALVVILRTRGCSWARKSGCLMCGYNVASLDSVGLEELLAQLESAMRQHEGQPYVKFYTSGSFFDSWEVPAEVRDRILSVAGRKAKRVLVESRPEFISVEVLDSVAEKVGELEVALGLETADDEVRERCVNKGFSFTQFEQACGLLVERGMPVRTYLLLKPPFLTEKKAMSDMLESIEKVSGMCSTVSINPVNVQKGTLVEKLWRNGQYRPPWLWSLLEVLTKAQTDVRVMSNPSGGGTKRGVHNCGKCDKAVLAAVREYSLTQDKRVLEPPVCDCREEWLDWLDIEGPSATTGDLKRLFRP
jgi:radical SAM enzyme (TIGR01210 family)